MFATHPFRNMVLITVAVVFFTLFTLTIVTVDKPSPFFSWAFGALTGASWALWLGLYDSFLRGED